MNNIIQHFVKAAAKKGIENIDLSNEEVIYDNPGYKFIYYQQNGNCFTIYSDGLWDWNGDIEGRLMQPHNKKWVGKLVKEGVPLEFAKAECFQYRAYLEQSKGNL